MWIPTENIRQDRFNENKESLQEESKERGLSLSEYADKVRDSIRDEYTREYTANHY